LCHIKSHHHALLQKSRSSDSPLQKYHLVDLQTVQTWLRAISSNSRARLLPTIHIRLLNTTTFELKDFLGEAIPEYAILSHTWDEEEIILQDLLIQTSDDSWKRKKSFKKVSGFLFICP
jgi:hypothetical protein